MSVPSGRPPQRRRRSRRPRPTDLWSAPAELPAPDPIRPARDPAALVRSLGQPPLGSHATVASHYMAAVVERAAALASALAATADLLVVEPEEDGTSA
jgi:hypothetical protein